MIQTLYIGSLRHAAEQLWQAAEGKGSIVPVADVRNAADLARLMGAHPSVVFVEVKGNPTTPLALASAITQHYRVPVVLISDDATSLGLSGMRAGARDIVEPSASLAEYTAVLGRAVGSAISVNDSSQLGAIAGKVITVASPKGGVGKTTIATNLAVGLALIEPESTVIVDLDVQFGDVASALNITSEYTLPDATRGALSGDALALKTFLTRHETGLYVVAGADSPAESEKVSPHEAGLLIQMLAASFPYVIIDTSPGLTDHALAALDVTNELVLVTSLDVPGIRGMRMELDTLTKLGLLLDARHIVLNFNEPARGLVVADAEATIGVKIDFSIPPSNVVPLSINQGVPLIQSARNDAVTKELKSIVERIAGISQAKRRRGFLGLNEPRRGFLGRKA